jgi:nucleoside 2-deoxyribosyltransferase
MQFDMILPGLFRAFLIFSMQVPLNKLIYLAGPISGMSNGQETPWRQRFATRLKADIHCLSPTRDQIDPTPDNPLTLEKLRHGHASVTRDRSDVMRCDLVVANFLGANAVSIGSVGELFWADAYRKPIIVIMNDSNPHYHLFILELAGWVFSTIDEAADKVNVILSEL